MRLTFVLCHNVMDFSKIQSAANQVSHEVKVLSSVSRMIEVLSKAASSNSFDIVLDYYIYEKDDLSKIIEEINNFLQTRSIAIVQYRSFVPHELVGELKQQYKDVDFIARSIFFHDIKAYLEK